MSDLPVRRYNEQEVSKLLKRASELQRSSAHAQAPSGMTLKELEDIAGEAGLDVTLLRRAAAELDAAPDASNVGRLLAGGPTRLVLERTLPFEVPESAFSVTIPAIEMAFGNAGQVGHAGQTFTWHANNRNSGRSQQLRIIVRGGETNIRIEESYGGMIGGLFGGVLGGVGGGVGLGAVPAIGLALNSTVLAVGLPALFIGGLYGGLRYGFKGYVQKRRRALEHLLHDMSETLRVHTPAATK